MSSYYKYILVIALLLIPIIIILVLLIRKFSDLVLVDVDAIQKEKDRELKDKLLVDRLERRFFENLQKIFFPIIFIFNLFKNLYIKVYKKIEEWEKAYRLKYRPVVKANDMKEKISILLSQANKLLEEDKYEEAEREFLEVISHDKYNIKAYIGLAKLYYRQKELEQAKEILFYVLKVYNHQKDEEKEKVDLAQIYYYLYLVHNSLENFDKALEYIQKTVENESKNPKYLNDLLDLSIKTQNKYLAKKTLDKIKDVNPDNVKIENWQIEISKLKD